MSSPRPLLALAGGVLAIILASLGGVAYLTLRTGPLAERLVREVEALARARHPRPSHVTPAVEGTFAEQLEPRMGDVLRLYREQPEALRTDVSMWPCQAVAEGREPVAKLPSGCAQALEAGRAVMAEALAATHAEEGGLPEGLRVLASPAHPYASEGHLALLHVVRLAALETRLRLEQGHAEEAVDTCLDALALSRDLAAGGGLVGHMFSVMGYGLMYRPCAAALDAAPLERKRTAVAQLVLLSKGLTPFSRTLSAESAAVQLMFFAPLFPSELVGELPAGARDIVAAAPAVGAGPDNPLDARLSWHKTVKVFDALVKVADQDAEKRRRGFTNVAAMDAGALYRADGPEVESYQQYADRAELLRVQHDALLALAEVDLERAEKGRWPEPLANRTHRAFTLESTGLGEARLKPCTPALAEQELRVTADVPSGTWVQQAP